jgi:membrane associated rhomboid family serine protease
MSIAVLRRNQPVLAIAGLRVRFAFPVATWSIVVLLVAVWLTQLAFLGQMHGGRPIGFLALGALPNVPVAGRGSPTEWWRYVTAALVHLNSIHLLGNCFALVLVGRHCEHLYGRVVLVVTFVLGAAGGSFAWMVASSLGLVASDQMSIGASGGICAIAGLLMMCGRIEGRNTPPSLLRRTRLEALFVSGVMLALGLVLSNVNDWAHVGGLSCGALLGAGLTTLPCHGGRTRTRRQRAALLLALGVSVLAVALGALHLGGRLLEPPMA